MLKLLGVINSDQVNKYNMKFSIRSLESAYNDTWQTGVPSFLNHDHQKPIAWSRVRALHFEPGMVRTANLTYVPQSEQESQQIGRQIQQYYTEKTADFVSPHKDELLSRLQPHLSDDYNFCATESAAIVDKNLARKVFPELFSTSDKHGLVLLSKLNPIAPGIFEKDGLLIYASSFFRRSFSRLNTLNTPFLKCFQKISATSQLKSKIALDPDMIGLAGSYHEVFEFQYWWGPLFTENLNDISPGVATHKSDERHAMFTDVDKTEFWWYEQNGIQTFECEEVITRPSLGISSTTYGCRFVHSMIDRSSHEPYHLDGAIRIYDEDRILNRWDKDISTFGKDTDYNKIWRLDGDIKVSEWKELISHYYRDNMLVGEYFGGEDKEKDFKPEIIEPKANILPLDEYVPCHMEKGQGIRISLSYENRSAEDPNSRKIRSLNTIHFNGLVSQYIEADTVEVIKKLRARGELIKLPPPVKEIIAFEDLITNFPLFLHRGKDAVSSANVTMDVIQEICSSWQKRNDDRAITFNIQIQYDSKDVVFSFAGHIEDLICWFAFDGSKFPHEESNIGEWCENTAKFITEAFPKADDTPKLGEMLTQSGRLYFDRRFLDSNSYRLQWDEKVNAVIAELKIPTKQKDLFKVIKDGNLQITVANKIEVSTCSKCKMAYKDCNCSKYTEDAVSENMEKFQARGVFWTQRKA